MKKIVTLLLVVALLAALPLFAGCKKKPDADLEIRVSVLNGTTGFGMAQLIDRKSKGEAALNYTFTVETDATVVRDGLLAGTVDIGALPTNVASVLYNSKPGEYQLLALNTRGVLYLVANTAKVEAPKLLSDLDGKTVYCPAQNPTFITQALISMRNVLSSYSPGIQVTLDSTTYAQPANLQAAVAAGEVDYAVLPEPMVTIAIASAAEGVTPTVALDFTAEWNRYRGDTLVQGCVVARKAFIDKHSAEVEKFLEEYHASIDYVVANPAEASQMIVDAGIFAKAPVAQKAIPKCNLCFVTGAEMKTAMSIFLSQMPLASIGGALPGDDFYYGA